MGVVYMEHKKKNNKTAPVGSDRLDDTLMPAITI